MAVAAIATSGRTKSSLVQRAVIVLLAIVAVLALAAWAATILLRPHPPSPAALTRAMRAQAALTGGEKIYVTHCAYCHETGFGPAIAHLGLPAASMRAFVRGGPAMMPAFTLAQVSDADIDAVAVYVNALPRKDAK